MDDSEKAMLTATDTAHHALSSPQVDQQCRTNHAAGSGQHLFISAKTSTAIKASPELAAAEHGLIVFERQHVPLIKAKKLEEGSDQELPDGQDDGHHKEQRTEGERRPQRIVFALGGSVQ